MQNAKTQCLSHDNMEFRREVCTFTFRLTKANSVCKIYLTGYLCSICW